MTRMDMVWIAVADLIHPQTAASVAVSKQAIDKRVYELFEIRVTPVMITAHLVNSVGRQADTGKPARGGSRKRYLARNPDGRFRLYKHSDARTDAVDKTGPCHPSADDVDEQFRRLISWYRTAYVASTA